MEKKKKLQGLETESRVIQSGDFYFLVVTAWEDEKEYVKEIQVLSQQQAMEIRQNRSMPSPLQREVDKQMKEYFEGERKEFDLPLRPAGNPFW